MQLETIVVHMKKKLSTDALVQHLPMNYQPGDEGSQSCQPKALSFPPCPGPTLSFKHVNII